MAGAAKICLGQIGAAHGVRGEVRLRSFTSQPAAIASYGPLETEDGRVFQIESLRPAKDHLVAKFSGIGDRSAAERLAKLKLYVPRERLPELADADEFYHSDLIGLAIVDRAGQRLGTVVGIYNFGAGDVIEMRPSDGTATQMLPFDAATVPEVDVAGGRMVVAAVEGMFLPSPLGGEGGEGREGAEGGEGGEAKPSRIRGPHKRAAARPLSRTGGSRWQRSTRSRKSLRPGARKRGPGQGG